MARQRGLWYVTTPDGHQLFQPSRRAARVYAREHGGARSGYRSNEYEHRRSVIRERVTYGFVQRALGSVQGMGAADRTTALMLTANWRYANDRGDTEGQRRFSEGLVMVNNHATGGVDDDAYVTYMKDLFAWADAAGYVDRPKSYREWLYKGKS